MSNESNTRGQQGERVVVRWLRWRGYHIRATNVRTRGGEIDIVASRLWTLHIIEVKALSGDPARAPGEAVTYPKRRRVIAAANEYVARLDGTFRRVAFDVAEVWLRTERVRFIADAYRADEVTSSSWRRPP